jgi:hypothetical protein
MDDDTEVTLFIDGTELPRLPFAEACNAVWRQGPLVRAQCRIVTREHTYDAAQLESMRREDEI